MRTKVKRLILVAILCYSCILLVRSANANAKGRAEGVSNTWEEQNGGGMDENRVCNCRREGLSLKFYLGENSYVTVDVALVAAGMILVFLLVLERM